MCGPRAKARSEWDKTELDEREMDGSGLGGTDSIPTRVDFRVPEPLPLVRDSRATRRTTGDDRPDDALAVGAEEHARDAPQHRVVPDAEARVGGARTDTRQAPPDTEDRPADEHVPVHRLQPAGVAEPRQRRAAARAGGEQEHRSGDEDGAAHHEQQPEVPQLQEGEDDLRAGHLTEAEPEAEEQPTDGDDRHEQRVTAVRPVDGGSGLGGAGGLDGVGGTGAAAIPRRAVSRHGDTPSAITSSAVPMAITMNVATLTTEVIDADPTPQIP